MSALLKLALASATIATLTIFPTRQAESEPPLPEARLERAIQTQQDDLVEAPTPIAPIPTELQPICACESKGSPTATPRQFNDDGTVIEGPGNNWGVCQINATAHEEETRILGLDYMTREGNIAFAEWLYAKRGYKPWYKWSGHCWENDPRVNQEKLREAREALEAVSPTPPLEG